MNLTKKIIIVSVISLIISLMIGYEYTEYYKRKNITMSTLENLIIEVKNSDHPNKDEVIRMLEGDLDFVKLGDYQSAYHKYVVGGN